MLTSFTATRYGWARFSCGAMEGAARFELREKVACVVELVVVDPPRARSLDVAAELDLWALTLGGRAELAGGLADRLTAGPATLAAADDAERRQPSMRARWGRGPDAAEGQEAMMRLVVEVPAERFKSDGFYAEVAAAYAEARRIEPDRPAVAFAEANGVPPAVARQWVKEARRRGLLEPGRAA